MLNISHTIYPDTNIDFNTWMINIHNRPKQEDLSIKTLNQKKVINCNKPLGYFYVKPYHNIYQSLIQYIFK